MPILYTPRLELHPTSKKDATFLLELLNSPKWIQNIGDRQVHTIAQAEQYIAEKMEPQAARLGFGNFTLVRKEDGQKIGTCGLYDREGLEGVDIGFALLPAYEGKGYAFEAAQKLLKMAQKEWKLSTIQGITLEKNIASRRLLEKLGLEFKKYIHLANDEEELMLYSRILEVNL